MKKFEILQVAKMWLRDMKWANAVAEAALIDVQTLGGHKPSNLPKMQRLCFVKHKKARYAYSNFEV